MGLVDELKKATKVVTGAAIGFATGGPTGAVLGATSVLGAQSASKASEKAAKAQEKAAKAGIAEQRAARESFEARTEPFRQVGLQASQQLQALLSDPNAGLEQINPIVSFLRDEGFEQIQESAAARGLLGSGGTLKDLTRFNTNLSTTVAPQLQQQRFNQLFNTAGLGSNVAAGQGTAALSTASNIGNLLGNIGAAQAAGATGQANAFREGLTNLASAAGAFPGLFQQKQSPDAFGGGLTGQAPFQFGTPDNTQVIG
jgi:hypothetical protein